MGRQPQPTAAVTLVERAGLLPSVPGWSLSVGVRVLEAPAEPTRVEVVGRVPFRVVVTPLEPQTVILVPQPRVLVAPMVEVTEATASPATELVVPSPHPLSLVVMVELRTMPALVAEAVEVSVLPQPSRVDLVAPTLPATPHFQQEALFQVGRVVLASTQQEPINAAQPVEVVQVTPLELVERVEPVDFAREAQAVERQPVVIVERVA